VESSATHVNNIRGGATSGNGEVMISW
jgi:hypothetical protein